MTTIGPTIILISGPVKVRIVRGHHMNVFEGTILIGASSWQRPYVFLNEQEPPLLQTSEFSWQSLDQAPISHIWWQSDEIYYVESSTLLNKNPRIIIYVSKNIRTLLFCISHAYSAGILHILYLLMLNHSTIYSVLEVAKRPIKTYYDL